MNLERRPDRLKSFMDGVGNGLDVEIIKSVDGKSQAVVRDYDGMQGGLGCRASHAIAWVRCVTLQENLLIFEDDVLSDITTDWVKLAAKVDEYKDDEVIVFGTGYTGGKYYGDTLAYVVTPVSASIMLERHLRILNPVNVVQMSVDHRINYMDKNNIIKIVKMDGYDFYQTAERHNSDNDWLCPLAVNTPVIYPK